MRKVILASRSNPSVNPKISSYEYLKQWYNDPDVYISFTTVDKVGINPQSKYNTPIGIYTYPLQEVWVQYNIGRKQSLEDIPFAGNAPHIWVIRPKNKSTFVEDMHTDYGSDKFDKDETVLLNIFVKHRMNQIQEVLDDTNIHGQVYIDHWKKEYKEKIATDWESLHTEALRDAKIKNPVCSFWNLARLTAIALTRDGKYYANNTLLSPEQRRTAAIKWNWLLRKCGYSGFADKTGKGYIHNAEPIQAVFLSKDAFKIIGRCDNKSYSGKDPRNSIKDMTGFIEALCKVSAHIDNSEYEYDKDLLKWLVGLGSMTPLYYIPNIKVGEPNTQIWKTCSQNQLHFLVEYCRSEGEKESIKGKRWWRVRLVEDLKRHYNTFH